MKVVIADDDVVYRRMLEVLLTKEGYDVQVTSNGQEAWQVLQLPSDVPRLALLDWEMPQMDGITVCRQVRSAAGTAAMFHPIYLMLVTSRDSKDDIVAGLDAGADDYITKPFHPAEVRARVRVGQRFLELRKRLADHIHELTDAIAKVKQLQGLLPICCYCMKVRDDQNYWQRVEAYFSAHADVRFSHGICPECFEKVAGTELAARPTPSQNPSGKQ